MPNINKSIFPQTLCEYYWNVVTPSEDPQVKLPTSVQDRQSVQIKDKVVLLLSSVCWVSSSSFIGAMVLTYRRWVASCSYQEHVNLWLILNSTLNPHQGTTSTSTWPQSDSNKINKTVFGQVACLSASVTHQQQKWASYHISLTVAWLYSNLSFRIIPFSHLW